MVELSELLEVPSPDLSRGWRAKVETPDGVQEVHVLLGDRELKATPGGNKPLGRAFSEDEIREAVRLAVERQLLGGGTLADVVTVTSFDLYRAAGEVC